jgi:hypothetical protein
MSCQDVRPTPHFFSSLSEQRKRDAEWENIVDLGALGATGALGSTGLEAVREAAVDVTEGAHAAGAGGLAALGLLAPVVLAGLSSRVAAVGAGRLLDVEGPLATTTAQSVSLVVALAEARSTLGCWKLSVIERFRCCRQLRGARFRDSTYSF